MIAARRTARNGAGRVYVPLSITNGQRIGGGVEALTHWWFGVSYFNLFFSKLIMLYAILIHFIKF